MAAREQQTPNALDGPREPPAPPSREAVLAGIVEVARRELDYDGPVRPDSRLVEDLELDSIRLLTLAVEVENHFRVALSPEDEQAIQTVGDLVEAVHRQLAEEAGEDV